EKPIARTLEDARTIVDTAERTGVVCAIGYQWHALELLDDVRRELGGQRLALLAGRSIGPTHSRPWFLDRGQGGGNVLERGSHHIDLQRAVAGEIVSVQAAPSAVLVGQGAGERGGLVATTAKPAIATGREGAARPRPPGLVATTAKPAIATGREGAARPRPPGLVATTAKPAIATG